MKNKKINLFIALIFLSCIFMGAKVTDDVFSIGEPGSVANKVINLGDTREIRSNETSGKLEFTNDGISYKDIGSGAVAKDGSGGINILLNANFEEDLLNWTNSGGGTLSVISNSETLEGAKSFDFDAASVNDKIISDSVTINDGMVGVECEARIYYTGGDANLILEIIDGNALVIASKQLSVHTLADFEQIIFTCPDAAAIGGDAQKGNLQFQVRQSTGVNAAKIVFDKNYLGIWTTSIREIQFFPEENLTVSAANWTTAFAVGYVYRIGNIWRLRFNINGSFSGKANNNIFNLAVSGVTFGGTQAVVGTRSNQQSISISHSTNASNNTSNLATALTGTQVLNIGWFFSGDVFLTGKPSFIP